MANRVKFEFLKGQRKTEEELLAIVQKITPEFTPTDCWIARSFGLITFITDNNVQLLFEEETMTKFTTHNLQPKPQPQYYTERTLLVGNIKPFMTLHSSTISQHKTMA